MAGGTLKRDGLMEYRVSVVLGGQDCRCQAKQRQMELTPGKSLPLHCIEASLMTIYIDLEFQTSPVKPQAISPSSDHVAGGISATRQVR
jgi:hypothetical protein